MALTTVLLAIFAAWALGLAPRRCLATRPRALPLFAFEEERLDAARVAGSRLRFLDDDAPPPIVPCRAFPGSADWPSDAAWHELDAALDGRLLRPAPAASVCYNGTVYANYNATACARLVRDWATDFVRMDNPIEVVSPLFEGLTCLPPTTEGGSCTQGGYPTYVANVSTVAHVQAAVNYARNHNVRLVIKNTGHDFLGKSLGAGALSVWTHGLQDVRFLPNVSVAGYTGPAFHVGAGVQGSRILQAAADHRHMVLTGICDSVGVYGGYSLGGGHSPLSALHGLAADQILVLHVVTADGRFRTASPTENTDLFWALRGGGGSTFGVVTSMVVKAYADMPTAVATFSWGVSDSNTTTAADAYWKGVRSYFAHFAHFTDVGLWAQFYLYPPTSSSGAGLRTEVSPFMGVGKTLAEVEAATRPWLDEMRRLGVDVAANWQAFPSFRPAFFSHLSHTNTSLMPYNMTYGSRLIPRRAFDPADGLNATVAAYRALSEAGHVFNGFQLAPTLAKGRPVGADDEEDERSSDGGSDSGPSSSSSSWSSFSSSSFSSSPNAVLPAWRDALSHTIVFAFWSADATPAQQLAVRRAFATGPAGMQQLRDATPGSGSYMSEADRLEPDAQQAFYGRNYARLLVIKERHDPHDVFYAPTAVGSEFWRVHSVDDLPTENGRLCRV